MRKFIVFRHSKESLLLENIDQDSRFIETMSFELAQEVSTVFKGTSILLKQTSLNIRCGQKSRSINSIKKLPKTK